MHSSQAEESDLAKRGILELCAIVLASTLLLHADVAWPQSPQYYDRFAFVKSLPMRPFTPKSTVECDRYSEQANQVISEVHVAHEGCLRQETSTPYGALPADRSDRCSKPACQALHDARAKLRKDASNEVSQCNTAVADYQAKVKAAESAEQERRNRDAQSSPCAREWLQYEAVCTGGVDTQQQQKTCTAELQRLRRSCPNR